MTTATASSTALGSDVDALRGLFGSAVAAFREATRA